MVFAAVLEHWANCHCPTSETDHFEQASEFSVGEEIERQVKQNYKHEVHLLVLNNHFVVPVIDSLDLGKAIALGTEVVTRRSVQEMVVAGTKVVVAAHRTAGVSGEAVRMVPVEAVDSGQTLV